MIKSIEERFSKLCEDFSARHNAVFSYKESNKKTCVFTIELNLIKIEFCFFKKASTFIAPGTLYCRIFLSKNSIVHFHIPDLLATLKADDFRACYFSFIENPERMENCFKSLACILKEYLPKFEEMALDSSAATEDLFNTYKKIYKLKESDINFSLINQDEPTDNYFEHLQKYREQNLVGRLTATADPYKALLNGNREKAAGIYTKWQKKDPLHPYEEQFLEFLKSPESLEFSPMTKECISPDIFVRNMETSPIEFFKVFIVAMLPVSTLFCSILAIIEAFLSYGSIACFCTPWYFGFAPAFICGFFGSIAFRNPIRRLIYKSKADSIIELDKISNPKWANRLASCAFAVALILSLFFIFALSTYHITFKAESFKYDNDEFIVTYIERPYEDIDRIYYIKARYNEYGERIERDSYVVAMKDGEMLDLDGYTSVKKTEKELLPFLEEKGFTVEKLDSDKDLPKTP